MSTRGVDLATRYADVRAVVLSHPAFRAAVAAGMDGDDLLSDVVEGILVRNAGSNPWDPQRCGLSHYVWIVTTSRIWHAMQRERLWLRLHQVGVFDQRVRDEHAGSAAQIVDAAEADLATVPEDYGRSVVSAWEGLVRQAVEAGELDEREAEACGLALEGLTRVEMAQRMGVSADAVVVRYARKRVAKGVRGAAALSHGWDGRGEGRAEGVEEGRARPRGSSVVLSR